MVIYLNLVTSMFDHVTFCFEFSDRASIAFNRLIHRTFSYILFACL